jgi:exosortase
MSDIQLRQSTRSQWIVLLLLLVALVWSYWTTLALMAAKWESDPQYSHGYLVPLFALVILWFRRDKLDLAAFRPSWWGLPVLAVGIGLRLASAYYYWEWFDFLSLIPTVTGVCLVVGGWAGLRWAWPAIGFLFFMIPLAHRLEIALREPLRRIGTVVSTYLMQMVGLPALAEGNVIHVNDARIGVVEACSGLNMMMVFFALSTAVAILSGRSIWQRLVIVASAVPIAVLSNILRITVTGILHVTVNSEVADWVFHDVAGWLMMPMALGMLGLELWLLSHLVIVEEERPVAVGLGGGTRQSQQAVPAGG